MQRLFKQWVHRLAGAVLALVLLACMVVPAYAVDIDNGLTVANGGSLKLERNNADHGGGSASGNTIQITATGYKTLAIFNRTSTTTLTITNTGNRDIIIKYETYTNSDTTRVSGSIPIAKGESDKSLKIESPSGSGTNTRTIIITSIQLSGSATSTVTFRKPVEGGKYTAVDANNTTKYDSATATVDSTDVASTEDTLFTLTATANSGWRFSHWADADGKVVSTDNPYNSFQCLTQTIQAVFYKSANASYFIAGTPDVFYGYLDQAIQAAGESGTIVVAASGNAAHSDGQTKTFTIPAGVTLLIPYDDGNLVIQSKDADAPYTNYLPHTSSARPKGMPLQDVYRSLTILSGTTITLAGSSTAPAKLVVGGILASSEGVSPREGGTYGNHGNLVVDGNLKLDDYAILSTCGYVIGNGEIETIGENSAIYQPMVINDWRGAAYAALASNNGNSELYDKDSPFASGEIKVCPFTEWGFINIRTKLKITEGNSMMAYCSLLEGGQLYTSTPVIIGAGGLLKLADGAYLSSQWLDLWTLNANGATATLYPLPGQNLITIVGGATMGTLGLTVQGIPFSSNDFTLFMGYNLNLTLSGEGAVYEVGYNTAILPGASITIDSGSILNITASRFVVLDGLTSRIKTSDKMGSYSAVQLSFEANTRSDSKCYPTAFELRNVGLSSNGAFIVNGQLNIGASTNFGGIIQATQAGATINVGGTDGSTVSGSVMHGLIDAGKVNLLYRIRVGASYHNLNAKILSANGDFVTLQRGKSYKSGEGSGYLLGYTANYYYGITSNGTLDNAHTLEGQWAPLTNDDYPDGQPIYGMWECNHKWSSNCVCEYCGKLKFYATNINMGDNLDLLFAIPVSAFGNAGGQDYYVVFQRGDNTTEPLYIENWEKRGITNNNQSDLEGTDYYVLTYGAFAAKEMCEEVTVLIYGKQEDGSYAIVSVSLTTSIRKYALSILKNSSNDALKKTVTDMLNYGAACQKYFDPSVSTDQLANYNVDQTCASNTVYRTEDSVPVNPDSSASTRWYATQIVAESSIRLRIAFDTNVTEGMYFSYAFKGHKGNALKHEDTKHQFTSTDVVSIDSTTYACGIIDTLVTADAGLKYEQEDGSFEYFEIEIKVYDSNGNELETFTECIMDYVIRNAGTDGTDVYTMLMRFSESALAYQTEKRG